MKKTLLIFIAVILSFSSAIAHWAPEDGHKMHFPQLPDSLGWDVNATQPLILADDFMCTETGFIKDIHFWGSWKNGVEGQVLQFMLSLHSDLPADPPAIPYSRPDSTLWEAEISDFLVQAFDPPTMEGWYDPASEEIIPNSIGNYFQYNVFLPDSLWFPQDSGTIYWLNISAIVQDPVSTQWGWKSTLDHWNDDAVWAFWGDLNWIEMYEPGSGGYQYIPGDVNGDSAVTQADVDYLYDYFQSGPPPPYSIPGSNPPFYAAADANGNCLVSGGDITYLQSYINGGAAPQPCSLYIPGGYQYIPGDVNDDDTVTQTDVDYLIDYLFGTGPPPPYSIPGSNPPFYAAADANGNCLVSAGDVTYLQSYINGGAPPQSCSLYTPGGSPSVSLDLAFVINNRQTQEDIPTLNEWGMLIMGLLLLAVGTIAIVRRRKSIRRAV